MSTHIKKNTKIGARTEVVQTSAVNDEFVLLQREISPDELAAFSALNAVRAKPLQVCLLMRVFIVVVIANLKIAVRTRDIKRIDCTHVNNRCVSRLLFLRV